jgi:uncharacterized membrane protein
MCSCRVPRLLMAVLCGAGISSAAPIYSVYPILTPPGVDVDAFGLNDAGQVTGWVRTGGVYQPFIGTTVGYTVIPLPPGWVGAAPIGINDSGQVAGWGWTPTGSSIPFIGTASGLTPVSLPPGWSSGRAHGINDSGRVAGYGQTPTSFPLPFTGTASGLTPIPLPPGWSWAEAYGINDSGQVAGYGGPLMGPLTPFIGTASGITPIPFPPGWSSAYAYGINDSGQVAGWGWTGGHYQAFIGTTSGSTGIPLIPGWAGMSVWWAPLHLNNAGQMVGEGTGGGWIWDPVNGARPLDALAPAGWHMSNAISINDRGQILAYGWTSSWTGHVLLDPIPEPATGLLLAGGLMLLAALARRKRHG